MSDTTQAPSDAPPPSSSEPTPAREPPPSQGSSREAERNELLAAVQDVVKVEPDEPVVDLRPPDAAPAPEPGSPSPSQQPPTVTPTETQPDPLQVDPTQAELDTYKPDTRRRIEQLLSQRNEARQGMERFKADAEAFATFRSYQDAHQLTNEDVNLLLATGAALRRGDFKTFLDGVLPYVDVAQQAVGSALPADLQAQVESGQIPPETAREISMRRINEARLQIEANTYREHAQLQGQQNLAQQIYQGVAQWEAQTKARDPDWALKQDIVERFSQSLVMSQGRPTTPDQAVRMAQMAYEEANRVVERMRPQPQATRPQPSGVQNTTGNGATYPEPRNLMEAAILGLQRGTARVH